MIGTFWSFFQDTKTLNMVYEFYITLWLTVPSCWKAFTKSLCSSTDLASQRVIISFISFWSWDQALIRGKYHRQEWSKVGNITVNIYLIIIWWKSSWIWSLGTFKIPFQDLTGFCWMRKLWKKTFVNKSCGGCYHYFLLLIRD